MQGSIVSYPERGHYGKSSYRGNCTGYLVRDMLLHLRPSLFVDPAEGSGTSRDVAREFKNMEYVGLDLHSGFNLLKDSLKSRLGGRLCDYLFFHPPYADMIRYSNRNDGGMWGEFAHPDDLSRCESYEDFLTKISSALSNIYDAVKNGGHYSILIGDIRRNGEYISIQSDLLQIAPAKLCGIIIKQQHNTVSDRKSYSGNLIRIHHEYLLNFKKELTVFGLIDTTLATSTKLGMLSRANWRGAVTYALNNLGGKASLEEIYSFIESTDSDKTKSRPNWKARVRATLQEFCKPFERGVWGLTEAQ